MPHLTLIEIIQGIANGPPGEGGKRAAHCIVCFHRPVQSLPCNGDHIIPLHPGNVRVAGSDTVSERQMLLEEFLAFVHVNNWSFRVRLTKELLICRHN
jgi:hypothetical protein